MEQQAPPTHFICAVGTTKYTPTDYTFDGRTWSTRYAPAAVAHLCGVVPGRATILATRDAQEMHFASLQGELETAGFRVEPATVNAGVSRGDFVATLIQLVELVGEGERVVLDVTYSFRHLPFTYLAALTYLSSFKRITVGGIYYGAWEQGMKGSDGRTTAPILDLTPLFGLTQWYHAVQSANESGDLRPLQHVFEQDVRAEKRRTHARSSLERVDKGLHDLAPALAAGLPIEAGLAARRILDALPEAELDTAAPELAPLSLKPLVARLDGWAVPEGVREKAELRLDRAELRRQLRLIRWYVERENVQEALLLLREWLLSRVLFERGETSWLGFNNRKKYEAAINVAAERVRRKLDNGELGALWDRVTDARNFLAHADTELDKKLRTAQEVRTWVDRCEALLSAPLDVAPPGSDRILLTPLGLTPGVVFTAATCVQPDQAIIITSGDAEASAAEALVAAGMPELPREVRVLSDPWAGIDEAVEIAKSLRPMLVEARELVVNLTGGTTAMQMVVEQLAQAADRLGIPVRRVFLIDRRSAEEQRSNPYVLGELVSLGGANEAEADA